MPARTGPTGRSSSRVTWVYGANASPIATGRLTPTRPIHQCVRQAVSASSSSGFLILSLLSLLNSTFLKNLNFIFHLIHLLAERKLRQEWTEQCIYSDSGGENGGNDCANRIAIATTGASQVFSALHQLLIQISVLPIPRFANCQPVCAKRSCASKNFVIVAPQMRRLL